MIGARSKGRAEGSKGRAETGSSTETGPDPVRWWRLVAVVAGLVGAVLAVSVPFLPVHQQQSSFSWPQSGQAASVTAPLVSYSPTTLNMSVPCTAVDGVGSQGGMLLTTVPAASGQSWHNGLNVVVQPTDDGNRLQVVLRDQVLVDTPTDELASGCQIAVSSDSGHTTVQAGGDPIVLQGDHRPQVVGLFTDLSGAAPAGMHAHVGIDSRFTTSPTVLKLVAIVGALIATVLALFALHRLDGLDGRRNRRVLPHRWWRLRLVDGVVLGILVLWYFIGSGTSDDGYIFGMARTAGHAGYLANYFAYFGVPETPIGIPYDNLFELMARISPASVVVRLPELILAIICWLLISHEVVPRLGVGVRLERSAIWAGGLVFLAFWLPYNNGLRAEPAAAVGVLLTWVSMERALATRRLTPAAVALIPAALAVVANPEGLICVGALLAGARPLVQIIVARARRCGWLALIAPALATGLAVLTIIFAGQTFAAVAPMRAAHTVVGPDNPWYNEYLIYQSLFEPQPDGGLARRFPMLIMFLALAVAVLVLLRKNGRIPGLAAGPTRRMLGTTVAAIPLMMFSPTKFTHHLGAYAGLGGAVAVIAAVAVGARAVKSARNRALFAAAVVGVLAVSFASSNGWWYVASYRIPWWDKPISLYGHSVATAFLAVSVLLILLAGWFHIREPFRGDRAGRWAVPMITIAAALVLLFEVASFGKAAAQQYPAFSLAKSNFAAVAGKPCGLADDVLVEPDPNTGVLPPLSGDAAAALGAGGADGFTPNGINFSDLNPDASDAAGASTGQSLGSSGTTTKTGTDNENKGSGSAALTGINGSTVPLPYGLNQATTPMLGTYGSPGATKSLQSDWYQLPADVHSDQDRILALAAAGRIASTDIDDQPVAGQNVRIEYGAAGPDGVEAMGQVTPEDVSVLQPSWRNLRVPVQQLPTRANVVRIVATVDSSDPEQWVAVTPPRVPKLQTVDSLLGRDTPVLLDWLVGMQFPCQQPFQHRYGVADLPRYRITPDLAGTTMTTNWESHASGGPLGYTQLLSRSEVMPSYLRDDWKRNWGEIERLVPIDPAATPAQLDVTEKQRSGTWTPGPLNFGIR